jgi:DNA-binding transcriptional LysR family regulator
MTLAAKELALTQSGVSQHMKALEEILELKLFDRVRQKLVPTTQAKELFDHVSQSFDDIERVLSGLKNVEPGLSGGLSIGFPIEFGINIVLPLLADFQKKYPKVHYNVRQGLAHEMSPLLMSGELDFAFVDSFRMDPAIETTPVYNEVLDLCYPSSWDAPPKKAGAEFFEKWQFVDYQEEESILSLWMRHHLGWKNPELDVRFYIRDAKAVSRLIRAGIGAGVLPHHLVKQLIERDEAIRVVEISDAKLINEVHIAQLKNRTLSSQAKAIREWLVMMIPKKS